MNGLILYQKSIHELDNSDYSVVRFIEAAEGLGVELTLCRPENINFMTEQGSLFVNGIPTEVPDFFLPCLMYDTYHKMAVVRQLEALGSYCLNALDDTLVVRDKLYTQQKLAGTAMPSLKTILVNFSSENCAFNPTVDLSHVESTLGYPVVVKNITGMRGYGINLCENESQLKDLVELVYQNNKSATILLQEYIAASKGTALRVYVLGDKVIGHMKHSTDSNFKSNFTPNTKLVEYDLPAEVADMSLQIANIFNLTMTGIDYLFDFDRLRVCEVNAFPGFKGLEKATGKDIASTVLSFILAQIQLKDRDPLIRRSSGALPR